MQTQQVLNLPPDNIRFINIYGVQYYIPWEYMNIGSSVFLKTTAHERYIKNQLMKISAHYGIELAAANRCEYGYYGIRIWRMT